MLASDTRLTGGIQSKSTRALGTGGDSPHELGSLRWWSASNIFFYFFFLTFFFLIFLEASETYAKKSDQNWNKPFSAQPHFFTLSDFFKRYFNKK